MVDAKYDVKKGYLATIPTTWKNSDGTVINFTNWTAEITIRDDFVENSGQIVKTFTSVTPSNNGDTVVIDIPNGTVTVNLEPATTTLFVGGKFYFLEVTMLNASNKPERGLTIELLVTPSVR